MLEEGRSRGRSLVKFGLFALKVLLRCPSRNDEEAVGYKGQIWNGVVH